MLQLKSQALAQTRLSTAHVGATALRHAPGTQRSQVATQAYVPSNTVSTSGTTLATWTSTLPDVLALGPRLTLGAISSLSDVLSAWQWQAPQRDLDRLNRLLSDSRPFDAKRPELEALMTTYIQRGAGLESQILKAIGDSLPQEWRSSLPLELQNALAGGTAPAVTTTPGDYTASSASYVPEVPTSPTSLVDSRTAAEMVDLRGAVVGVRETLEGLSGSVPSDQIAVMQLNAREKRDLLARKIRQLSPSTLSVQEGNIIAAVKEASLLLADIDDALDL